MRSTWIVCRLYVVYTSTSWRSVGDGKATERLPGCLLPASSSLNEGHSIIRTGRTTCRIKLMATHHLETTRPRTATFITPAGAHCTFGMLSPTNQRMCCALRPRYSSSIIDVHTPHSSPTSTPRDPVLHQDMGDTKLIRNK
jgi:hypothetical protein